MATSQANASAPSINSVREASGVEIANGAKTTETSVTLSGDAQEAQMVEVFDGTLTKGAAAVDSAGNWFFSFAELSVGSHSVTVRALYGFGEMSEPWTFTVVANK